MYADTLSMLTSHRFHCQIINSNRTMNKRELLTIVTLFAAATLGSAHTLPKKVLSVPDVDAGVWDMSLTEDCRRGAEYIMFGDTLLCENIDRRMRWYSLSGDTVAFFREETSLHYAETDTALQTSSFGTSELAVDGTTTMSGMYCGRYPVSSTVAYSSRGGRRGVLVNENGDSIDAYMSTERMCVRMALSASADSVCAPTDSLPTYEIVRHRWFAGVSRLPIAVATAIDMRMPDGRCGDSSYSCYIVQFDKTEQYDTTRTSTEISCSDGQISILASSSGQATFVLTTLDGMPCMSRKLTMSAGEHATLDCGTLPRGRYVGALTIGGHTAKELDRKSVV